MTCQMTCQMTLAEYGAYDAVGLAALVRAREVTASDLVDCAFRQIGALDGDIGAIVHLDEAAARLAAETIDPAAPLAVAPLAGVPFLIKDTNLDVAGMPTRHGSFFYRDRPAASADSELVRRWRAAGLIILGKSKTPEFAGDFVTEPSSLGPARNPHDLSLATGGSSGGAAAAVAARYVPAAHGSDCGGSIRVPAAVCGVIGLKPTRGRVPVGPDAGELVSGLDCEYVLTRTVRDTAVFLDISAAVDPGAPYQAPASVDSWLSACTTKGRRQRIGVTTLRPDGSPVDDEIAAATLRIAAFLDGQGHHVEPFVWPEVSDAGSAAELFWQLEIAALIEQRCTELGRRPRPEELEPLSWAAWERTKARSALDYHQAKLRQNRVSRAMARAMGPMDAVLLPTTAAMPPRIGGFQAGQSFDYAGWSSNAYAFAPFTEIFNLTGQPAISLPVAALSATHLPIGVQIAGRFGDEAGLLALSAELEAAGQLRC